MNFSKQQFDLLAARAEDAAAQFDGKAMHAASAELMGYIEAVVAHPGGDQTLLTHIRGRLQRYHALCGFLQSTLQSALFGALQHDGSCCYGRMGQSSKDKIQSHKNGAHPQHLAPLFRRYC